MRQIHPSHTPTRSTKKADPVTLPAPYYEEPGITIYHADCNDILPHTDPAGVVCIMDPPYGIDYKSNKPGKFNGQGIANDESTAARDTVIDWLEGSPYACFGSWKIDKPPDIRTTLIWHKNVGGMGDLSLPWSPDYEEIYIAGPGWQGHRGSSILTAETIVTWSSQPWQRKHPNEKPVGLMTQLIQKAPPGTILDPYMGSGPIAKAARDLDRNYIGIEIEQTYCNTTITRLAQQTLPI